LETSVAKYCLEKKIPLVMGAISRDGIQMYCAVQEPEKACFGCIRPNEINDHSYPCNLPGIIDINQVVAGFMVYALDTILMNRNREWNLKMVFLDGSVPETSKIILRNADCQLCNNKNK
jgi:molybdopterin/thiamine biosynthesis adenylyltransferase